MSGRFSIVLSGGGCKVFWANGALEALRDLLPRADAWAGVSAGVAFALAHAAELSTDAFDPFLAAVEANERNFYPRRVLRRQRPCPHDEMYRDAVFAVLANGGLELLRQGPPVYILLSYVEPGERLVPTSCNALQSFITRKRNHLLHGPQHLPPGFGLEVVSSHEASDAQTLIDWTMMSGTIPPFVAMQRRDGRRYLDAGIIDNVPIRALPEHARGPGDKVLCLVSHEVPVPRQVTRWIDGAEVLYLSAQAPLPVRVWDYTSVEGVNHAMEIGRRDGQRYRERVAAFLA